MKAPLPCLARDPRRTCFTISRRHTFDVPGLTVHPIDLVERILLVAFATPHSHHVFGPSAFVPCTSTGLT
jgi:hypothetical protein